MEHLPPVEPPSAGFIIQLFVVPALIVLVIVGVWLLFGKLASGEQDWRKLTAELASHNEHIRWRAALGLAQLLKADAELGSEGQHLARHPQVAEELSRLFLEKLRRRGDVSADDLKQLEFLARTLGFLDVPEATLPALREAMLFSDDPDQYRDVRRTALAAAAMIAGRRAESGGSWNSAELAGDLIEVSRESDPTLRQLAAFALGLLPHETARARLHVLLSDSDADTRLNAAIGLTRHGSTEGIGVLTSALADVAARCARPADVTPEESAARHAPAFDDLLIATNSLKAVDQLTRQLSAGQRAELRPVLQRLADDHPNRGVRAEAARLAARMTKDKR